MPFPLDHYRKTLAALFVLRGHSDTPTAEARNSVRNDAQKHGGLYDKLHSWSRSPQDCAEAINKAVLEECWERARQ